MGLIQLSSARRIKKEVLLSLCLLFPCVVCSIITRCTHTLFGGWWGVLGTISFHLKCCVADLQKKKIITHCGFCPQSLPSRQLQIDLYVSTSFISAPSSRPPVAGSLRVTPSKRAKPSHLHFRSLTVSALQIWSACKVLAEQIKSPLKTCLWSATWHIQFHQLWLWPVSCTGWWLIKQRLWRPLHCPSPPMPAFILYEAS